MSDTPFLITPPPGLLPEVPQPPAEPADTIAAPVAESTVLIELPAGFNTGTRKMAPSRGVERAVAPVVLAPTFPVPAVPVDEAPAASEAAPEPEPARWRLLLPGGVAPVELDRPVVVGRKPKAHDEYPDARLVPITDPSRTVSSSHALFGLDDTGLWLADLDSTNGTVVTSPEGVQAAVHPDTPVYLANGSAIEFGQYRATLDFS